MLKPSNSTYFVSNVESLNLGFNLIGLIIAFGVLFAIFKFTPLLQSLSALIKLKPKHIGVIVVSIWIIAFTTVVLNSWGAYQVQNAI